MARPAGAGTPSGGTAASRSVAVILDLNVSRQHSYWRKKLIEAVTIRL